MIINEMFSNVSQNKVYKLVSSHFDHTVFSERKCGNVVVLCLRSMNGLGLGSDLSYFELKCWRKWCFGLGCELGYGSKVFCMMGYPPIGPHKHELSQNLPLKLGVDGIVVFVANYSSSIQ